MKKEIEELKQLIEDNNPEVILKTYDILYILTTRTLNQEDIDEYRNSLSKLINKRTTLYSLRFPNQDTIQPEYRFSINGYRLDSIIWFKRWVELNKYRYTITDVDKTYNNIINLLIKL
jgi:hypothetical protein